MFLFYKPYPNQPQFELHVGKNKKVQTGGGRQGDIIHGVYRWEDNRFYINNQNPLTDSEKTIKATYGQQIIDDVFKKIDDTDYLTTNGEDAPF